MSLHAFWKLAVNAPIVKHKHKRKRDDPVPETPHRMLHILLEDLIPAHSTKYKWRCSVGPLNNTAADKTAPCVIDNPMGDEAAHVANVAHATVRLVERFTSPAMISSLFVSHVQLRAAYDVAAWSPQVDLSDPTLKVNQTIGATSCSYRLSPSLAKSTLQKNVRLTRGMPAVRTALYIIKHHGLEQLLRRMLIIMVEDVVLHPEAPYLTWLMFACTEMKDRIRLTSYKHLNTVLRIVYDIASCKYKDAMTTEEWKQDRNQLVLHQHQANQTAPCHELVYSLLMRAQMGGMNGDMKMLRCYAALWQKRFQTDGVHHWLDRLNSWFPTPLDPILSAIEVQNVGCLTKSDIPISAVDFHCSQLVDNLIDHNAAVKKQFCHVLQREVKWERVKSMIWNYRSSLTNKKVVRTEAEPLAPVVDYNLYVSLKEEIDREAKDILERRSSARDFSREPISDQIVVSDVSEEY